MPLLLASRIFSHSTAEKVLFCLCAIPLLIAMMGSEKGRTMSEGNWTDILTAGGAVVAAGAAVYTAYLAKQASDTWLRSLEYQRIDEAIIAVLELRSKAYRILDLMKIKAAPTDVSDAYTDAWSSCNRFEQTYQVARRYSQSQSQLLSDDRPKAFNELLTQLREPCDNYDPARGVSDNVRELIDDKINRLSENTTNALRSTRRV
jgi:hypothetical protein